MVGLFSHTINADKKGEKTEDGGDAYGTCTAYFRLERAASCC